MENNLENKEHWDNLNIKYSNNWMGASKEALSQRELGFVNKYLNKVAKQQILDIGVGNGRILQNFVKNTTEKAEIFAVDISDKMVEVCKKKFEKEKKVKSIKICDVSLDGVCFENNFDFVSAIRVLKYNKNWREIIEKIHKKLNNNGVFVFTVLNKNSISRFSNYGIPVYSTTRKELEVILGKSFFEILEIRTFSRIPDFFYFLSKKAFYARCLIFIEKILELILGKVFLGKALFIAVRKKP